MNMIKLPALAVALTTLIAVAGFGQQGGGDQFRGFSVETFPSETAVVGSQVMIAAHLEARDPEDISISFEPGDGNNQMVFLDPGRPADLDWVVPTTYSQVGTYTVTAKLYRHGAAPLFTTATLRVVDEVHARVVVVFDDQQQQQLLVVATSSSQTNSPRPMLTAVVAGERYPMVFKAKKGRYQVTLGVDPGKSPVRVESTDGGSAEKVARRP